MNFLPVTIAPSGPLTFRCMHCMRRVIQIANPLHESPHTEPVHSVAYANLDGAPFRDYFCAPCVREIQRQERAK